MLTLATEIDYENDKEKIIQTGKKLNVNLKTIFQKIIIKAFFLFRCYLLHWKDIVMEILN